MSHRVTAVVLLVLASTARAQGTLSTQGLGYPPGQLSTRAASMGGSIGEADPLSPLNPAALVMLLTPVVALQADPEWQKYLSDNYFQDGFMRSAELSKFFDEFIVTMRNILKDSGAKVVR